MIWIHLARDFRQRLLWSRKVKMTSQLICFSDLMLTIAQSAVSVMLKVIQQFNQFTKCINMFWKRMIAWMNSSHWQIINEIEDHDLYTLKRKILIKIYDIWSVVDSQKFMYMFAFKRLSLKAISEILNLELLLNNKLQKQRHFMIQTLNDDVRIFLKQSSSYLNSFIFTRCHVNFLIRHVCIKITSL